jgi:hypothetical protein
MLEITEFVARVLNESLIKKLIVMGMQEKQNKFPSIMRIKRQRI